MDFPRESDAVNKTHLRLDVTQTSLPVESTVCLDVRIFGINFLLVEDRRQSVTIRYQRSIPSLSRYISEIPETLLGPIWGSRMCSEGQTEEVEGARDGDLD